MPELPEVETFRRYIAKTALQKTIRSVKVHTPDLLEDVSASAFRGTFPGKAFVDTARHGKNLFVQLSDDQWVLLHFGMTGDVQYFKEEGPEYKAIEWFFDNRYHLAYISKRKIGKVMLMKDPEEYIDQKDLGPDALDADFDTIQRIGESRGRIKGQLMNQKRIAGLGNLYVDEILYQAQVHPETKANQLSEKQLKTLYSTMSRVLEVAVRHQAKMKEFPRRWQLPRRHKDGTCPKHNQKWNVIKVGGRSTYICTKCQ